MKRWLMLAALLGLLAALGLLLRDRLGVLGTKPSVLKGRYANEEQWLVGEISRDIAEMALFAAGRKTQTLGLTIGGLQRSGEPKARVDLSWDGGSPLSHEIATERFVWAPESYRAYALVVLGALQLRTNPTPIADDESLLTEFLNPQARVIETQNQRVAGLLSRNMLDPVAHEQAALVVGSLVLREAAGLFHDSRQLLSRMTAHLALASALRGAEPPGISGRYAEVILLIQAGRSQEAMDAIARLREVPNRSDIQERWINNLAMRNTGDWRTLRLPEQASLLERLEYFADLGSSMNTSVAIDFYERLEPERITDWARIAMAQRVGASSGAHFAGEAVERELEEASDVWQRIHSKRPSPDELVAALNQPAERCLTSAGPRPLGWGTWAASLQRHLCHQLLETDRYVRQMQGLKDDADAEVAKADSAYGPLALYAVARIERANRAEKTIESIRDALEEAISNMVKTPELVNLDSWLRVGFAARYAPLWRGAPDENVWFATDPQFATTFESIGSRRQLRLAKQDLRALEALLAINPFNDRLKYRILELRYGKDPSADQIEENFREESQFDLGVLYDIALPAADDPPRRRGVLARVCALWVDGCLDLAGQLVQDGLDDEAVKAYELAIEKASDRVWVSNRSRWLMRRYYAKGRVDRARTIATMAAEVYSGGGIATMGDFLEREGRLDEAEEYYQKGRERYDDDAPLLGFYYRRARIRLDTTYEEKLNRLLRKVFPAGLKKLDKAQFAGAPKAGVEIRGSSANVRRLGLGRADIIVGVDGWEVRTLEQYEAALEFTFDPVVKLYAWHAGRFAEKEARLPDGDLEVELVTLGSRP